MLLVEYNGLVVYLVVYVVELGSGLSLGCGNYLWLICRGHCWVF